MALYGEVGVGLREIRQLTPLPRRLKEEGGLTSAGAPTVTVPADPAIAIGSCRISLS